MVQIACYSAFFSPYSLNKGQYCQDAAKPSSLLLLHTNIMEMNQSKETDSANIITMKKYPVNVNFVHPTVNQQSVMFSAVGYLVVKHQAYNMGRCLYSYFFIQLRSEFGLDI